MPSVNLKKTMSWINYIPHSIWEKLKIMIFSCITSNFTRIYSSTGIINVISNVYHVKLDKDRETFFFSVQRCTELKYRRFWITSNRLSFFGENWRFTHYVHAITTFFDLVSATIAETTVRCTVEVINIERAAVSHLNVSGPATTVWTPVETDLPGDFAISHCRMTTI